MGSISGQAFTSLQDIKACTKMYDDPDVVICKNRILLTLKKDKVIFMDGENKLTPTQQWNKAFNKYWYKFMDDFISTMFILGEVPVAIVESTDPGFIGFKYPCVPEIGTYVIGVEQDKYQTCHKFYALNYRPIESHHAYKKNSKVKNGDDLINRPGGLLGDGIGTPPMILRSVPGVYHDDEVIVERGYDRDIDVDGQLHSRMMVLLNHRNWVEILKKCALNSELINCNPALYMENEVSKINFEDPSNARVTVDAAESTGLIQNLMNSLDKNLFNRVKEHNDLSFNGVLPTTTEGVNASKLSFCPDANSLALPRPPTEKIPLPSGAKISHQPRPISRTDLTDLIHMGNEKVFQLMGVPMSVVTVENANLKGNSDGMNKTLEETIGFWRSVLNKVMTKYYNIIYGNSHKEEKDHKTATEVYEALADNNIDLALNVLSKHFIEGINTGYDIELSIQPPPRSNPEELFEAFKKGLIPFERFQDLSLKALDIQDTYNGSKLEDPLSKNEHKHMVLTSYGIFANNNNGEKNQNTKNGFEYYDSGEEGYDDGDDDDDRSSRHAKAHKKRETRDRKHHHHRRHHHRSSREYDRDKGKPGNRERSTKSRDSSREREEERDKTTNSKKRIRRN